MHLKRKNHTYDYANTPEEVLSLFTSQHYDFLILGAFVDEYNGYELLQKVKQINPNIPTLILWKLLSDGIGDYEILASQEYPIKADYYLKKPPHPLAVMEIIEQGELQLYKYTERLYSYPEK